MQKDEEGAMYKQKFQKWFVKFHTGDFLLNDTPQSSRLVKIILK